MKKQINSTIPKPSRYRKIFIFIVLNYTKIINILIGGLILSSSIVYRMSLIGCYNSFEKCIAGYTADYVYHMYSLLRFVSIALAISLILLMFKKVYFWHTLYFVPIYSYLIISDQGQDFSHHGYYTSLVLLLGTLVFLIISLILLLMIKKLRERKMFKFILILFVVSLIVIKLLSVFSINGPCTALYLDLEGQPVKYDNRYDSCKMTEPLSCYMPKVKGLFDVASTLNDRCHNHFKDTFIRHIKIAQKHKKSNRFGYPSRIFKWKDIVGESSGIFRSQVREEIFDLERNPNIPYEFEVQFDEKQMGSIKLNFTRNETLVKEREEKRKKSNFKQPFKNVLYLYIDAVSRAHFIRQMPETVNFIKRFLYKPNTKSKESISSFEFPKLNGMGRSSRPNNLPLFAGESLSNIHKKEITTIFKKYKDLGFITGTIIDILNKYTYFLFMEKKDDFPNVNIEDPDHEGSSLFADPNYYIGDGDLHGPYGASIRCLYGKEVIQYMFDYTLAFWKAYIDQPKVFKFVCDYGHEYSMEVIRHADIHFKNFLEILYNYHYLDNTILYFMSDHGNHINPLYELWFPDYLYENLLPFLYIIIPNYSDSINKEELNFLQNNLYFNKQRWITHYDFYNTNVDYLYYSDKKYKEKAIKKCIYGDSLFSKIKRKERSCKYYKEYQHSHNFCMCRN